MLSQEEREMVEELNRRVVSTEVMAHLIQHRRSLSSQSEKVRVLPHFLELLNEVTVVKKYEDARLADNRLMDRQDRARREADPVGGSLK